MLRLLFIVSCIAVPVAASEPPITAIAFGPKGDHVVGVSQRGLQIYRWPGLELTRTLGASMPNVHAVAFSQDGKHFAVGGGFPSEAGVVSVLSWPSGKTVATFTGHDDSVRAVAWLDNSRLISASMDRTIKQWDLQRKEPAATLAGHSRSVDALCLLSDGKILVSAGADQSLRVWELETGGLLRSLNQHTAVVNALALRPVENGLPMIASAASDRTIRFWQPTIGRMVRYIRLDAVPLSLAWFSDGKRIVAGCNDGHVRIVDSQELTVLRESPTIDGWAYAIKSHPTDESVVVAGSNAQIRRLNWKKVVGSANQ